MSDSIDVPATALAGNKHYERLLGSLRAMGATFDPAARQFMFDGIRLGPDETAALVAARAPAGSGVSSPAKAKALMRYYVEQLMLEEREKVAAFLARYDEARGMAAARAFLGFLQDVSDARVAPTDLAALRSFVWQIKRKARGHYVNHWPLMMFFVGGQAYGKTSALRRLFEPIAAVVSGNMEGSSFYNAFNAIDFSRYLVCPFNEFRLPRDPTILDRFKALVSDGDFQYRDPGTKMTGKLANTATLYGTSNHPVARLIEDDTGARRWWEVVSPNRPNGMTDADGERLNAIPFADVWLCTDGSDAANPRTPFVAVMTAEQNTRMRFQSHLETAFDELVMLDKNVDQGPTDDEVYATFVAWHEEQGLKRPLKQTVREAFLRRGLATAHSKRSSLGYFGFQLTR